MYYNPIVADLKLELLMVHLSTRHISSYALNHTFLHLVGPRFLLSQVAGALPMHIVHVANPRAIARGSAAGTKSSRSQQQRARHKAEAKNTPYSWLTIVSAAGATIVTPQVVVVMVRDLGTSAHPGALALARRVTRGSKLDTRTRVTPECGTRMWHPFAGVSHTRGGGCTCVHPPPAPHSRSPHATSASSSNCGRSIGGA
ncbi:hypothetical protein BDZ89DRAFT_1049067 [Hymenopellis radicata]|nr:hypothetical protein BDZ89DRAFT_1049067 [Hymenopellis radicata]